MFKLYKSKKEMTKTVSIQTNTKHKEEQGKKIPIKELKHEQKTIVK